MATELKIGQSPSGFILPVVLKEDYDKLLSMCSIGFVLSDKQREPNKMVHYCLFGNQWFSYTDYPK